MTFDAFTTLDTLTVRQIAALHHEALIHGNDAMMAICTSAMAGDEDARAKVVAAIQSAEAMIETD